MAHPVLAAKDALRAILDARPAWNYVEFRDAPPTETEDVSHTGDAFWWEAVEVPEDGWASLGARGRRLTFRIGFSIVVIETGDDSRTPEEVAWNLYEDLELAIKANPTLNNTVRQVTGLTGRQGNGVYAPSKWQSAFSGAITCLSNDY